MPNSRHCINYFVDCFTIDESNQVKTSLEIKWHQGNFLKIPLARGWIDVKACIYLLVALLTFVCYLQLSRHFICWYMMVLSHFQWIFCWLIHWRCFYWHFFLRQEMICFGCYHMDITFISSHWSIWRLYEKLITFPRSMMKFYDVNVWGLNNQISNAFLPTLLVKGHFHQSSHVVFPEDLLYCCFRCSNSLEAFYE